MKRFAALALLVSSSAFHRVSAQEWPRFRGPNGAGTSASVGLPDSFGPEENLRWRTELPPGHSSPVLGEGTVFVTGADEKGLVVACLARDTGAVRWERRLERARTQEVYKANGAATPTPATDGANVYAFFPELGLVSFDAQGKERWRLPLGPFVNFYGMAGSPILAGNSVVLLCDQQQGSFLVCADATSGKERWRTERKGIVEGWTTPVLLPASAPKTILVSGTYFLCAYSLDTGKELWRQGGVGYNPISSPFVWERAAPEQPLLFTCTPFHAEGGPMPTFEALTDENDGDEDGRLSKAELSKSWLAEHFGWIDTSRDGFIDVDEWTFVADGVSTKDHGLVAFRVGDGTKAPEEAWRHKRSLPSIATPLLADGVVYVVKEGGMLTRLDATSGKELGFTRIQEAQGQIDASPVTADGKIFLATTEGRVVVLSAGSEPKVLASCELGETIHATPAIGGGALFVRTEKALYCFARAEKN